MLSKIENSINNLLRGNPFLKKSIKRIYQISMYLISPKYKSKGNLKRITPKDNKEYFFGYYDKSPWDITDRFVLCLRVDKTWKEVAPKEKAEIIIIDTKNNNNYEVLADTSAWNVQQGCMLQWLGPKYKDKIIYNDFRDDELCSVILNIKTKEEKLISKPIYSVSSDGKFALSLDFFRLHRMRPGYGYSNKKDLTKENLCPNETCIWKINLENNATKSFLEYKDFYDFENIETMVDAEHKVNHIMISPDNKRFMVLHRWYQNNKKFTRLITVDINDKSMYNLSDDNMTSHCFWKSNDEILAFAHKNGTGNGYYIMKDKTEEYTQIVENLTVDGHPSYSPNKKTILTDTYPNRSRISKVITIENDKEKVLAEVFAPFKYDNDTRCDLHPRWNREGTKICIDSVFEGKRALYILNRKGDKNE